MDGARESKVNLDNTLHQSVFHSEARGGFDPVSRAILLGNKSDFTTFAHEAGHYYLSILSELASHDDAMGWIKHDIDTLMKWFGTTHDGNYWDVRSAMPIRPERFKNKTPLWERAGASTSSAEANPLSPEGQSVEAIIPQVKTEGNTPKALSEDKGRPENALETNRAEALRPGPVRFSGHEKLRAGHLHRIRPRILLFHAG